MASTDEAKEALKDASDPLVEQENLFKPPSEEPEWPPYVR